jgi:chromate reductase, NAD(P)H dehydrogenase (quinone)
MSGPKLVFFAGSTRQASFNRRLAHVAWGLARERGFSADLIELADYPMPIYNGDAEAQDGPPENARKLRDVLRAYQGVFVASPEYNASIAPLLKNTLDWMTRVRDDQEPGLALLRNRVFAISGASAGRYGAMRSLIALRQVLELGMGVLVLPAQLALSGADKAFGEDGALLDSAVKEQLAGVVGKLGQTAQRLVQ